MIGSENQYAIDYAGWRNVFDEMSQDTDQFIGKYDFNFIFGHFLIKMCDEVIPLV